jgi:hypothetical protein
MNFNNFYLFGQDLRVRLSATVHWTVFCISLYQIYGIVVPLILLYPYTFASPCAGDGIPLSPSPLMSFFRYLRLSLFLCAAAALSPYVTFVAYFLCSTSVLSHGWNALSHRKLLALFLFFGSHLFCFMTCFGSHLFCSMIISRSCDFVCFLSLCVCMYTIFLLSICVQVLGVTSVMNRYILGASSTGTDMRY